MPDHPEIEIAGKTVPVYPQKHAYLSNRLGKFIDVMAVEAGDIDSVGGLIAALGDQSYEMLSALIPALSKRIPKWEWAGYGSQDAYDRGEYDERDDNSPTVPEIIEAFETAIRVNRFEVFKVLKGLVDPLVIKKAVTARIAESILPDSPNSPGTNGESPLNGSGTTPPTSESPVEPSIEIPANGASSGEPLLTSA